MIWTGAPVEVRYVEDPHARKGKLVSGGRGRPVHAGSFLRERLVLLDAALRGQPRLHARILSHELFHFAWVRLGNPRRREWEELLRAERHAGVSGECGWSAEHRLRDLRRTDWTGRTRRWREYLCEAFCDTGAWLATGPHAELTLDRAGRARRRQWFERQGLSERVRI